MPKSFLFSRLRKPAAIAGWFISSKIATNELSAAKLPELPNKFNSAGRISKPNPLLGGTTNFDKLARNNPNFNKLALNKLALVARSNRAKRISRANNFKQFDLVDGSYQACRAGFLSSVVDSKLTAQRNAPKSYEESRNFNRLDRIV